MDDFGDISDIGVFIYFSSLCVAIHEHSQWLSCDTLHFALCIATIIISISPTTTSVDLPFVISVAALSWNDLVECPG